MGCISEKQAAHVTRDVIKGVQHCYMIGIVHRNNYTVHLLCASHKRPLVVESADFALADYSEEGQINVQQQTMIGSPGYIFPEVVKDEQYGQTVCIWAVGLLFYIIVSGKMPFYGRDHVACLRMIASGN